MGTILKIFISIIRFIWKKLGVPGILFLVILVVVPVGVNSFDRASDDYAYEDQWEVNSYRIDKKEMTAYKFVLPDKSETIKLYDITRAKRMDTKN